MNCGGVGLTECTGIVVEKLLESNEKYYSVVVPNSLQSTNSANSVFQSVSYDNEMPCLHQWKYPDMFGDIFRVMFQPVPAIAREINATMSSLGLVESLYVSTHVRSRYPVGPLRRTEVDKDGGLNLEDGNLKSYLDGIGINALDCVTKLESNLPVFFVSDSHVYTDFMISKTDVILPATNGKPVSIRGKMHAEEPLHIDKDDGWPGSKPQDFYSVFEDLLIMGGSKCVAHGIGSFGSMGAGLIGNECRAIHRIYNGNQQKCPNNRADKDMCALNQTEMDA